MQFIDLQAQQEIIRTKIQANIEGVLSHGKYIMGPEVFELEEKLANFVGVKHCISMSSGTDALLVAMMALGVGSGDEVITTPFTFIATGEMVALLGATPVFVDIDKATYNIDPAKIENAITRNTKAIIAVGLFGQCPDMDKINAISEKYEIPVIEDAAQSFGATYNGRQSCSLSEIGCTSFFPSKPLGGYGDSGACFTDDDELAKAIREIRVHGQDRRYHHPRIGINGRMDTIQAAILLAKFEIFPGEIKFRQKVGKRYTDYILKHCEFIGPPLISKTNTSVYAQYTLQTKYRDELKDYFEREKIPTAIHYPVSLHHQPALKTTLYTLPISEQSSRSVISIPMHPYLTESEQDYILEKTSNFLQDKRE